MSDKAKALIVAFVVVGLIGYTLYVGGYEDGIKRIHREAVMRGFATWTNSVDGKATFTWKEAK